jgi:tetratricopeptide (TPR) repeat protein
MAGRFANLEFNEKREENIELRSPAQVGVRAASDAPDHLARAIEEHRWGHYETALRYFTRSLEVDRRLIPAWVGQVQMLVALREYHEAKVWSDKALELFRGNPDLLASKSQACIRMHDMRGAYAASDGAMQGSGSSPWRWQVRGELLLADGKRQYDQCFAKALAEQNADWFDRVIIARMLLFHRRLVIAADYFKQAVALEIGHACAWLELGQCQAALGMAGPARTSIGRALDLRPDMLEARRALDSCESVSFLRGLFRRLRGGR